MPIYVNKDNTIWGYCNGNKYVQRKLITQNTPVVLLSNVINDGCDPISFQLVPIGMVVINDNLHVNNLVMSASHI